jgi:uncharacterized membrane protein
MIGRSLFVLLITLLCPGALAAPADYAAIAAPATICNWLNFDQRRIEWFLRKLNLLKDQRSVTH